MRLSWASLGVIACLAVSMPFLLGAPAETEERLIDLAQMQFAYCNPDTALGPLKPLYPTFNAFFYSLETFVPFLHLNLSDNWAPNPNRRKTWRFVAIDGRALRIYLWFHIIIGFVLTTLWVGGLTALIKT